MPQISEIADRAAFMQLAGEWDDLVRATHDELFYRHAFIRIWLDHFAPRHRLRILVGRDEHGVLDVVLPLVEERTTLFGAPVRQWTAPANPHTPRFDLIARDAPAAGGALLAYLARQPGWDVVRIMDVPDSGNAWSLYGAAQTAGFPVGTWPSLLSPYIPLPATAAALQARLEAKFKANLRRRRKKLEALGTVTVERVTGGPDLAAKLAAGYALEQSGWKGREGSAIAQDAATQAFYSALAQEATDQGYLSLYFLRLDGRPVAFHYGLTYEQRYYLLKPAYDETYKECSPGHLLMDEVLRDCIARGLTEFDFLGPDMIWKRDWADQARRHTWLFLFRKSPYGQALRTLKFRWWPAVKERMAAWRKA